MTGTQIFDHFLDNLVNQDKAILLKLGFDDDNHIIECYMQQLINIGEDERAGLTLFDIKGWESLIGEERDRLVETSLGWIASYHRNHTNKLRYAKAEAKLIIHQLMVTLENSSKADKISYLTQRKASLETNAETAHHELLVFVNHQLTLLKPDPKIIHKELPTFNELFITDEKANLIKGVLEIRELTKHGRWVGESKNKSEHVAAFWVLRPLIKKQYQKGEYTDVFALEFGIEPDIISDRTKRNDNPSKDSKYFEKIFERILKSN